ncbi:MAG: hypothetical protein AAF546_12995 [Verrucomicrobiota bacterium]
MDSKDGGDEDLSKICLLFKRLGASETQAETMANQLLKRADQIAKQKNISKVQAVEMLLKKVIEARYGS